MDCQEIPCVVLIERVSCLEDIYRVMLDSFLIIYPLVNHSTLWSDHFQLRLWKLFMHSKIVFEMWVLLYLHWGLKNAIGSIVWLWKMYLFSCDVGLRSQVLFWFLDSIRRGKNSLLLLVIHTVSVNFTDQCCYLLILDRIHWECY